MHKLCARKCLCLLKVLLQWVVGDVATISITVNQRDVHDAKPIRYETKGYSQVQTHDMTG